MKAYKLAAGAAVILAIALIARGGAQTKGEEPGSAAPYAAKMPDTDRIQMAEFKKLLAADDVVVIDVRSSAAYADGHIPGALSVPEESINPALAEKLKRMGKPVAAYCS